MFCPPHGITSLGKLPYQLNPCGHQATTGRDESLEFCPLSTAKETRCEDRVKSLSPAFPAQQLSYNRTRHVAQPCPFCPAVKTVMDSFRCPQPWPPADRLSSNQTRQCLRSCPPCSNYPQEGWARVLSPAHPTERQSSN